MDDGKSVGFIFGLMVGALVGASVAILLAPQSGEETREILKEKTMDTRRKVREFTDNFKDDAEEWIEKGRKYISQSRSNVLIKKPEEVVVEEEAEMSESPESTEA